MFEAKILLDKAQKLEVALDSDGWDRDMEPEEVIDRGAAIDDAYRVGFEKAQEVSAQFYEEQALIYGWSTPLSRMLHEERVSDTRRIEDLAREDMPPPEMGIEI